jgi:hypothetical protein
MELSIHSGIVTRAPQRSCSRLGLSVGPFLFWEGPFRNSRATPKLLITESRLPVPGDEELGAVQELGSIQESSGEVGAIELRLEQVCAIQTGTRQIRIAEVRPP